MKAGFACGSMVFIFAFSQNLLCEQIFVKKIVLFHPASGDIHC
jgi:hypothetical protein